MQIVFALIAALVLASTAEAAPVVKRVERDVEIAGLSQSIVLTRGGLPLLAYGDVAADDLRIARCLDRRCSRVRKRVAARRGHVGNTTDTVVPPDGRPLIAYRDELQVSYFKCADRLCARGRSLKPDPGGNHELGGQFRFLLDETRRPFLLASQGVGHSNANDDDRLYLGRCSDGSCSRVRRHLGPFTDTNEHKAAAVDARGRLAIVHQRLDARANTFVVELLLCETVGCTRSRAIEVARDAETPTMALADGRLTIVYHDRRGRDLELARCVDAACSSFERRTLVEQGSVGEYPEIAVDRGNRPVVVFKSRFASLDVLRCADASCTSSRRETATVPGRDPEPVDPNTDVAIGSGGLVHVAFRVMRVSELYVATFPAS